jgi:hypothetical protein
MQTAKRVSAGVFLVTAIAACNRNDSGIKLSEAAPLSASTTVGTAPMFAVAPKGDQAVAWVSAPNGGTDGRLYVSVGQQKPAEIRDSLGPIEAHGEAPPKLSYGPDGGLYAAYTVGKIVPGERFPKSALRLVKSTDGGRTWSAPVTVTNGAVFGSHSFHGLHVSADGTVYVSWLGKADKDPSSAMSMKMPKMNHSDTAMKSSGGEKMAHEASGAWIARSTDGGTTWSTPIRVDSGEACPCCRTSVVSTKDGKLYMAWRHVYPGSIRDIVVAQSSDKGETWSAPLRVHEDNWKFDACPHAGPAIALDSDGRLHVAWWTGKEGSAGVYYAVSDPGVTKFGEPVAMGIAQFSRPAHVQLALAPNNRVIVAWDDGTKQIPQVLMRISSDGGAHFGSATTVSAPGRSATFPVLGVSGDSVAIAWSDESPASAQQAEDAMPKDKTTPHGLRAVGEAQVMVRRGGLD